MVMRKPNAGYKEFMHSIYEGKKAVVDSSMEVGCVSNDLELH